MKKCSKCQTFKNLTDFHKQSSSPDGRGGYCKSCASEYNRARREHGQSTGGKPRSNFNHGDTTKLCPRCQTTKPITGFRKSKRQPSGRSSYCKECSRQYDNERYYPNRVKSEFKSSTQQECVSCHIIQPKAAFHRGRRSCRICVTAKQYSLTRQQYDDLLLQQNNQCAICGSTAKLYIDHDHSCCTGAKSCGRCIRGMLCHQCNLGLGALKDSVEYLNIAIQYLSNDRSLP